MIRVEVDYNPKFSKKELQVLAMPNRLRNLRPLMQFSVAPAFNKMLQKHWDTQGTAFGHSWAPLAQATIDKKSREGTLSRGILVSSGHLLQALFRERSTDSRLQMIAGGLRFQANVSVPYAIYHQVGTSNMPDRQVIPDPLPRSFRIDLLRLVRKYIVDGITGDA